MNIPLILLFFSANNLVRGNEDFMKAILIDLLRNKINKSSISIR